jgi:hypothetical protein
MYLSSEQFVFDLKVRGYEFPRAKDKDDKNWLNIEVLVRDGNESWKSSGAYLRTFELVNLRVWFESISHDFSMKSDIYFTENELMFSYKPLGSLKVGLAFDLLPNEGSADDSEYFLEFSVNETVLSEVLKAITKSIESFPER